MASWLPTVTRAAPPLSPGGRPLCAVDTHGESKSYTSLYGVLFGLVSEEIAGSKGLCTALRPLRQKLTDNLPPGWAGRGRAGPQAAATPVAGATNVTPFQTLEDPLALLGTVTPVQAAPGKFESKRLCSHNRSNGPCQAEA